MRLHQNRQQPTGSSSDTLFRLTMSYDGSGRRISKTRWIKSASSQEWEKELVTHYTGIGTEVREDFSKNQTKVVVNMPQGLGRYGIEDAENPDMGSGVGYIPNTKFEWYLKNHLGSTMLVYGTQSDANPAHVDIGSMLAAYDYRAFGEMVELTPPPTGKVTENFTGKEHDDEIALDYFGARYLDPMLGMWISVDPARQFASPYLYAGNGVNPVNVVDPDGKVVSVRKDGNTYHYTLYALFTGSAANDENINRFVNAVESFYTRKVDLYNITMRVVPVDVEYAKKIQYRGINIIELKNKIARSFATNDGTLITDDEARKAVNRNKAIIFMLNKETDKASAHETGHLMGLKEGYDKDTDILYDGYKGNIMGDHGDGLMPFQIEETLNKKFNTYENFDPWNDP